MEMPVCPRSHPSRVLAARAATDNEACSRLSRAPVAHPAPARYGRRAAAPARRHQVGPLSAEPAQFNMLEESRELAMRILLDVGATEPDIRPDGRMSIVFAASEVAPWSKTGGLGDVCGALPCALAARGHRVMVVSPMYKDIGDMQSTGVRVDIDGHHVEYYHKYERGVDWVFVSFGIFFFRSGLYGESGTCYADNLWRFRLLSLAALEATLKVPLGGAVYGENVVMVANDWQTALVPVFLSARYQAAGHLLKARTALVIHNMRHQGVESIDVFEKLGLPAHVKSVLEYIYPDSTGMNLLKGGVLTADKLITVSQSYADEIQHKSHGCGLDGLLALRGSEGALTGIINGIDVDEWNPATDRFLPKQYGLSNFSQGKSVGKQSLQERLGLDIDPDCVLIGFIGRLDEQKGVDVLINAIPWMVNEGCQVVLLGTGTAELEKGLAALEERFPGRAKGVIQFSVEMSHLITAASDLLVMPSRFEPCGLNQIYAMRYGTPVIAHATGGLRDTVIHYDPWADVGTGWTFSPCDTGSLQDAVSTALYTIREHPDAFWGMKYRMIRQDFSWNRAAARYEELFKEIRSKPPSVFTMHPQFKDAMLGPAMAH